MDPGYWFRVARNKRLSDCDWTQMPDCRLSRAQKEQWETYRQMLRDLPEVTAPTFDDNRLLTNIKWPKLGESGSIPRDTTFTGQQSCVITDDSTEEGMVVCANQNKYGAEGTPCSNAITINESTPNVSLCSTAMDKSCFGVISHTFTHKRIYINSVGEGAMWVVNTAGSLESGDYITTSNVAGYGQRQESEFLANYTVAKITMDCDFDPPDIPVQRIVKELSNITYWYQLEDATSNAYDRTVEETYYTNDRRVEVRGYIDEQSNVFVEPEHDLRLYTKTQIDVNIHRVRLFP